MEPNAETEISLLRQEVQSLAKRLTRVEEKLLLVDLSESAAAKAPESGPVPSSVMTFDPQAPDYPVALAEGFDATPESAPAPEEKPAAQTPAQELSGPPAEATNLPPALRELATKASQEKQPAESLETKIGLYWLNRVGVASLVIGVALLILYSFQFFGAAAKIVTGYGIAALLIGLGEWMERKGRGMTWYARGLTGGGWSLAYFTTYAMHFVESVRVIPSPVLDAVLLLVVAAGATAHAIYRRSEIMALLAFGLGYVTLPLARVEGFALPACGVLTLAAAILSAKMQWARLYFWSVLLSYPCGASLEAGNAVGDDDRLASLLPRVGTVWAFFTGALFFFRGEAGKAKPLIAGTVVNSLYAYFILLADMQDAVPLGRFWWPLGLGLLYGATCPALKKRDLSALFTTHLVIALTLVTGAIPQLMSDGTHVCVWLVEIVALAYLGLKYSYAPLRWFAFVLAAGTGLCLLVDLSVTTVFKIFGLIPSRIVNIAVGVACYLAAALMHHKPEWQDRQSKLERWFVTRAYFCAGAFYVWLLPVVVLNHFGESLDSDKITLSNTLLPVLWALESTAFAIVGLLAGSRLSRVFGALGFMCTTFAVLAFGQSCTWLSMVVVLSGLYASAYYYRQPRFAKMLGPARFCSVLYASFATLMLTIWLAVKLTGGWVTMAWSLEGLVLLAAGIQSPAKSFRVSGLLVFALVMLKLLFVDLSGAPTVQRILGFIGAGVVLLLSSYCYSKFAGKLVSEREAERKADSL